MAAYSPYNKTTSLVLDVGTENLKPFHILNLKEKSHPYCPLKEKGCGWSGRLEQLEGHLHPDEGDCEYTGVLCPLKCQQKISRKDLTDHTANKCIKRDYICPYCAFKATYEIVSTVHWPECSYYPLPCPNRCGVTCERPTMEDHIKICPLEVVECAFHNVGCAGKFRREEEEEHMREKSQTHLTMMVTASVKMKQEFQEKQQEQEKRLEEQEKRFEEKLRKQEKKFEDQEKRFKEQEKRFEEKLSELNASYKQSQKTSRENFEMMLQEKERQLRTESRLQIKSLEQMCLIHYKFTMENFSTEKAKNKSDDWKSPAMYTHLSGYKFCIGIHANGYGIYQGECINVELWVMKGKYDDQLKWPVKARFTIELINHHPDGDNLKATTTVTWNKTNDKFRCINSSYRFIKHSELPYNDATKTHYLKDDALYFVISEITLL